MLATIEGSHVPVTGDEVASVLGVPILSVRSRVSELHRLGKIEPAPMRGKNASGVWATRWRPTPIAPDLFA